MSRPQDTSTPRQKFTALVQAELDLRMTEEGWSVSQFIRESKIGRTTMYEWLDNEGERVPSVEAVKRYVENLRIPFEPYAEALGWTEAEAAPPRDPEGYIERARRLAASPKTSERRRLELEAGIAAAEATLQAGREAAERLIRSAFEKGEQNEDVQGH